MEFTNLVTRVELTTGSAATSVLAIYPFLGMLFSYVLCFRPLGAVLRTSLLAIGDAGGIERAAHNVIAHSRQIFHAAAADKHDGVLLQVVAHARNVRRHLNAVGQAHARHFAQRRIRLLRRLRVNPGAYPALLGTLTQRRTRCLILGRRPPLPHQLMECRHSASLSARAKARFSLLLAGNIAAILPVRTDILRCRKIGFPLMSLTTVTSSRLYAWGSSVSSALACIPFRWRKAAQTILFVSEVGSLLRLERSYRLPGCNPVVQEQSTPLAEPIEYNKDRRNPSTAARPDCGSGPDCGSEAAAMHGLAEALAAEAGQGGIEQLLVFVAHGHEAERLLLDDGI